MEVAGNSEPKENIAVSVELPIFLFALPNTKPGPVVWAPNPVFAVPFVGLLRISKLAPLDGVAAKPPKFEKILGALSYITI